MGFSKAVGPAGVQQVEVAKKQTHEKLLSETSFQERIGGQNGLKRLFGEGPEVIDADVINDVPLGIAALYVKAIIPVEEVEPVII